MKSKTASTPPGNRRRSARTPDVSPTFASMPCDATRSAVAAEETTAAIEPLGSSTGAGWSTWSPSLPVPRTTAVPPCGTPACLSARCAVATASARIAAVVGPVGLIPTVRGSGQSTCVAIQPGRCSPGISARVHELSARARQAAYRPQFSTGCRATRPLTAAWSASRSGSPTASTMPATSCPGRIGYRAPGGGAQAADGSTSVRQTRQPVMWMSASLGAVGGGAGRPSRLISPGAVVIPRIRQNDADRCPGGPGPRPPCGGSACACPPGGRPARGTRAPPTPSSSGGAAPSRRCGTQPMALASPLRSAARTVSTTSSAEYSSAS
ncbi:hypothetical protein FB470_006736 [Amycolatopsis thermophila]|uniref:Uncharacterized protein n=1 Tax=Amycolatopsis thermophila TaxID=206084 RepID=A0ABU0F579_9PSEU|nr:hypothetical protein [Amycolatopsis thermophila]